jgi:rhodanese-related sulfurtransferase
MLIDRGWSEAYPLLGGFEAWRRAGYPVEPK